jgi:prevent-host-death family protein
MKQVNMHEAKTNLSRLVKEASAGRPFVIAVSGEPKVTVTPYKEKVNDRLSMLGFMKGEIKVPEDFDDMCSEEIEKMFS